MRDPDISSREWQHGHWRSAYGWYALAGIPLLLLGGVLLLSRQAPMAGATTGDRLRIVSLAPSITEIVFAVGAGESLVGVTDYCNDPPAAKKIERAGGYGRPNMEKLLSLRPDLVIAERLAGHGDVEQELRRNGIRILDLEIRTFQELFEAMLKIGAAVGKTENAQRLVNSLQQELAAVAAQRQGRLGAARPRVFVEIWGDPLKTVGQGSFIDELVTRAGGVNVAHGLSQAYPAINPEKVIEWNPDVIVVCYMSRKGRVAAELAQRIGWQDITAIRDGRIIEDIPAGHLLRPGPGLIEGVKELAQRLPRATRATAAAAGVKRGQGVKPEDMP